MNIVLFNHYAGSPTHGMEYRPYFMSKYWKRDGHNVTIVSSSFSHLRIKQPVLKWFNIYKTEVIDDIKYIWLKGNSYSSNGFFRFINILLFILIGILAKLINRANSFNQFFT